MAKGKIIQVIGVVVDVEFDKESLPAILEALTLEFEYQGEKKQPQVYQKTAG